MNIPRKPGLVPGFSYGQETYQSVQSNRCFPCHPMTLSYPDFLSICKNRRSTRYFSDRTVEPAIIDNILAAAHLSPSVENTQPWRFHIVTDHGLKTELMEHSCYGNFVAGAAAFIVVTCDRAAHGQSAAPIWNPKEMEYSCAGAIQSMMFAATTLGLSSCWVSLHHGPAHNALKITDHQTVVGGVMIGYPRPGEAEPSGAHDRSPLSNVIIRHA